MSLPPDNNVLCFEKITLELANTNNNREKPDAASLMNVALISSTRRRQHDLLRCLTNAVITYATFLVASSGGGTVLTKILFDALWDLDTKIRTAVVSLKGVVPVFNSGDLSPYQVMFHHIC